MSRPTFDELTAIARGAVDAVVLANPGLAVIVILQESVDELESDVEKWRTVAQSNVSDGSGAAICREMGVVWERSRLF